jgi:peptidoglycan/xylan/chitin deacetylase (PgdA/CDA1 family)
LIHGGDPWDEAAALITFDDGYRDNFEVAAPILRELGAPAVFFIPTGFFESPRLPWWDFIAYVIKQTRKNHFRLDRSDRGDAEPLLIDLERGSRRSAIAAIVAEFLGGRINNEGRFLAQLAERADVDLASETLGRELFMSWDQVKELSDEHPRFSIGSHAHSHQELAALGPEGQAKELAISKEILERRLGREVPALAYPFGWAGTFDSVSQMAAQQTGYRHAFSSKIGVNRQAGLDAYAIRRIGVGSTDSLALLKARCALLGAFGRSFL